MKGEKTRREKDKKEFDEFKDETMAEKSDFDHLVQPGGEPPTVTPFLRSSPILGPPACNADPGVLSIHNPEHNEKHREIKME